MQERWPQRVPVRSLRSRAGCREPSDHLRMAGVAMLRAVGGRVPRAETAAAAVAHRRGACVPARPARRARARAESGGMSLMGHGLLRDTKKPRRISGGVVWL